MSVNQASQRTGTEEHADIVGTGCTCGCGAGQPTSGCSARASSRPTSSQGLPAQVSGRQRRIRAPGHQIWTLLRKVRQLERLAARCTFYQRHEILDSQGRVAERTSHGDPFVHHRGLGRIPVDPEAGMLANGHVVMQLTLSYTDTSGRRCRAVRYRRLPCGPSAAQKSQTRQGSKEKTGDLAALLSHAEPLIPVSIRIPDKESLSIPPGRAITGLAFTEFARTDHVTPLRRRVRAENQAKRRVWAAPLRAWIRSVGGSVDHLLTVHGTVLGAKVPRRALKALLERGDVSSVKLRPSKGAPDESVDTTYLCTGSPRRASVSLDYRVCDGYVPTGGIPAAPAGSTATDRFPYQDAVNAAMGAYDYLHAGYTGWTAGGNATWSEVPVYGGATLSIGFYDDSFQPLHPAFSMVGVSRFLFVLLRDPSSGTEMVSKDMTTFAPGTDHFAEHGTLTASVAMANAWGGPDLALSTDAARGARSGLARTASALGATSDLALEDVLNQISGGFRASGTTTTNEGIDVFSMSYNINGGKDSCGGYHCPTSDDCRGLDEASLAVTAAYFQDNVVFVKSAGNTGGCGDSWGCLFGEVSAPGASPGALVVGALYPHSPIARDIQSADTLYPFSSGGTTCDGRTYPHLVATGTACGCATPYPSTDGADVDAYDGGVGTSLATPRIAGAAVLFKHWYIKQYGSLGASAGRIIVNLLNFADGFALDDTSSTATRVDPPAPDWGLGRLRMRLLSSPQLPTDLHWGTASITVRTGTSYAYTLGARGDTGVLRSGIRHLRITAWWLEVNTGLFERKAHLRLSLLHSDYGAIPPAAIVDSVDTDTDQMLRLQYDRDDKHFPCPPSGIVVLYLEGLDVPVEERDPGRDYRTVYLTWFWEAAEDSTQILCTGEDRVLEPCVDGSVGVSLVEAHATLSSMRRTVDASIRDTFTMAHGLVPAVGTSPLRTEHPC